MSAADGGLTGDIQFLQHAPFSSTIASPSASISLNKTGRERARRKYSKESTKQPVVPAFSNKPVIKPLHVHINLTVWNTMANLQSKWETVRNKMPSKLMYGAENVITVKPKHRDYYAFVIFMFVILITVPYKLQLQIQTHGSGTRSSKTLHC